jgi:isoleucyl-tRNA synthetase
VLAGSQSQGSIFFETFARLPEPDQPLLSKWERLHQLRDLANKEIEKRREASEVGSSLQAELTIRAPSSQLAELASLGEDLKFVFITSKVTLVAVEGAELSIEVTPATAPKCERCWHYRDDVGADAEHPTLCSRCNSNLYGAGETRLVA